MEKFIPVFLGSDAGAYGMARSFHEQYNIRTICLDSKDLVFCRYSKIVDVLIDEKLEDKDCFVDILIEFSKKFTDRKLILMAFCDVFSELLISNKEELSKYYIIPNIDFNLYSKLSDKAKFYELCDKYGLKYPKTIVYTYNQYINNEIDIKQIEKLKYPLVLKPAKSSKYWQISFPGKRKVYKIRNVFELYSTIKNIYSTDYKYDLILQEFIEGLDEDNYILNCYSDKNSNVKYMCMGNILLEEKGPTGIGSPSAIINYYDEDICEKIKNFLGEIKYVGFSNFDFKYDKKTNEFLLFEVNIRLGRSSYYANNINNNLAKLVIDDYIGNKTLEFKINNEDNLWHIMPLNILFDWVESKERIQKVCDLIIKKKVFNSLDYDKDYSESRSSLLSSKMLKYMEIYNFYKRNEVYNDENL